MKTYHLFVLVTGIALAGGILLLLRRDHLYIRQGLFWFLVAAVSLVFGAWPELIDWVGLKLDVSYPPVLILLGAVFALVIKALLADLAVTRLNRDLRRLNQRIALLEAERLPGGRESAE